MLASGLHVPPHMCTHTHPHVCAHTQRTAEESLQPWSPTVLWQGQRQGYHHCSIARTGTGSRCVIQVGLQPTIPLLYLCFWGHRQVPRQRFAIYRQCKLFYPELRLGVKMILEPYPNLFGINPALCRVLNRLSRPRPRQAGLVWNIRMNTTPSRYWGPSPPGDRLCHFLHQGTQTN